MCFISPKNVERKLENKEKKNNLKDSVVFCFFTIFFSLTVQPCNIICSAWVLAHKAEHMILHERSAACMK